MIKLMWQCMFSPRLYKIYKDGSAESMYKPHGLEKWPDRFLSVTTALLNIGLYTSPFICMYIYKRGGYSMDEIRALVHFFGGVGCLVAISYLLRGYGRASNPKYLAFLNDFRNAEADHGTYLDSIRKYDFDFRAWPVTYKMSARESTSWRQSFPFSKCANTHLPIYHRLTIQVLAYLAVHTFGIRLIYPGSMTLIKFLLWSATLNGRIALIEDYEGRRAKIRTSDGNDIDSMFIDNRSHSQKGKTLVICCEGNSGFYEVGILITPIKAGYSALGWNHPGFGGSTGNPYPDQERNAMDAVMQYAINHLQFKPENVVLFGWSIGGYAATWAATAYPIRALILDATFDDLLPLALKQMPTSISLVVKEVVRSHVDLNIGEIINQYSGPVQIIRRTEDEIICLRQGFLATNRANNLALKVIEFRHPDYAVNDEDAFMAPIGKYISLLETQRGTLERSEISDRDRKSLQLIKKYMRDFKSTHCSPLPEQIFDAVMFNIEEIINPSK